MKKVTKNDVGGKVAVKKEFQSLKNVLCPFFSQQEHIQEAICAFKTAILPPPNNPSLTILSTCFVSYTDVVMYTNFVVIFLSLFSKCHRRGGFYWER